LSAGIYGESAFNCKQFTGFASETGGSVAVCDRVGNNTLHRR